MKVNMIPQAYPMRIQLRGTNQTFLVIGWQIPEDPDDEMSPVVLSPDSGAVWVADEPFFVLDPQ